MTRVGESNLGVLRGSVDLLEYIEDGVIVEERWGDLGGDLINLSYSP